MLVKLLGFRSTNMRRCIGLLVLTLLLVMAPAVLAQGPPHIWSYSYGDTSLDSSSGLALDGGGNIILAGWALNADLGGGPMAKSMFLAKFDADAGGVHTGPGLRLRNRDI